MATTKQVSMKPERLHILAQNIAERIPDFFVTKGPGAGDHAANRFMELLNEAAKGVFGDDYSNKMACKGAKFCIDFYFPDEATAVEIALSLDKPISEYERDIFKCLLAKAEGTDIKRLLFVCKPGGLARLNAPGPKAIARYVREKYDLEIHVEELVRPVEA